MDVSITERNIVLVAHILAAILTLGPLTVAASAFPRYAQRGEWPLARAMSRITQTYGTGSLIVPAIGLYLAWRMDYFGFAWINWSLGLFVVAGVVLMALIEPQQKRILAEFQETNPTPRDLAKLQAATGIFGIIWVVILYLMVAKPN